MRALAQGVGSRRPLLLYPRGVPPARGCVVARLRPRVVAGGVVVGLMGEWWLGFAVVAGGVVSGGMSLVSLWLVFVGGLGGIATIGAALRRVAGVSWVYGRKTPRVFAWMGQGRVPVEGSMVAKPPGGCSKCSRPRWYAGDMGCLGCSGRRFGRAGSWRGGFCGAAGWACPSFVCAAGMIEPTVGA